MGLSWALGHTKKSFEMPQEKNLKIAGFLRKIPKKRVSALKIDQKGDFSKNSQRFSLLGLFGVFSRKHRRF